MVEKIKTDVDRLLLILKLKKNLTLKKRHHFSFVSNILHRNVEDKQKISFPRVVCILISTSKGSRKLPSIVVLYHLSSETDE